MATGTPCLVMVMLAPPATSSSKRGRWVFASYEPMILKGHLLTGLRLVHQLGATLAGGALADAGATRTGSPAESSVLAGAVPVTMRL